MTSVHLQKRRSNGHKRKSKVWLHSAKKKKCQGKKEGYIYIYKIKSKIMFQGFCFRFARYLKNGIFLSAEQILLLQAFHLLLQSSEQKKR